jgi:hypothetical protein
MKLGVTATFLCALSSQVVAEPRCVCDYHADDGHWEAICKSPRDVTPNCSAIFGRSADFESSTASTKSQLIGDIILPDERLLEEQLPLSQR